MDENLVVYEKTERSYFTILPNMVDDCGLTVYAFRLYAHLRRVAGEGGKCWQSAGTLAASCGMSEGSVTNAKNELVEKRLIRIMQVKRPYGGKPYHEITIVDIWTKNIESYASSRGEFASTGGELASSCGEIKKNSRRRTLKEKEISPSSDSLTYSGSEVFEALQKADEHGATNRVAYAKKILASKPKLDRRDSEEARRRYGEWDNPPSK